MPIQESGEMYLEDILVLKSKLSQVRAIDIVKYTGYTKPSVSRAVGLLKDGGYIVLDSDGYISLTESGIEIASRIYERHTFLTKCFIALGVEEKVATQDACRIEHTISDQTFEAIKKYAQRIRFDDNKAAKSQ